MVALTAGGTDKFLNFVQEAKRDMIGGEQKLSDSANVDCDGILAESQTGQSAGLYAMRLAKLPSASLLDERALAECLSVSTRTLRRMIARGQLFQGVKLGGRRMWVAGKVVEFLSNATDQMIKATKQLVVRRGGIGA